jgi:hypothetical protein
MASANTGIPSSGGKDFPPIMGTLYVVGGGCNIINATVLWGNRMCSKEKRRKMKWEKEGKGNPCPCDNVIVRFKKGENAKGEEDKYFLLHILSLTSCYSSKLRLIS